MPLHQTIVAAVDQPRIAAAQASPAVSVIVSPDATDHTIVAGSLNVPRSKVAGAVSITDSAA